MKKQTTVILQNVCKDNANDSDIDEDALLADSPSPPPTPSIEFRNRRVVLKPTNELLHQQQQKVIFKTLNQNSNLSNNDDVGNNSKTKGIFDRLEKKISVNEASKRAIQRIVINNADA